MPGMPGWMDKVDHDIEVLKPDSFKGYTVGDNTNKQLARHPWRMDDETLAATLSDKRNSVTVLYVNGAPAGFFELWQEDEDVVELSHFGLFERALGLGIGKWFLLQALYAAWACGPKRVRVTTNNLDHPRALQLYQMFGFSPVGTQDAKLAPLSDAELLALARRDCLMPAERR